MNNKKVLGVLTLMLASILFVEVAAAATTQKTASAPVQYTAAQKACLETAKNKRMASIKPAADIFNAATKIASEERQSAIESAQKITNAKEKSAAIKAANDAYNSNAGVQSAKAPYTAAIKAANEKLQNDVKSCLSDKSIGGFFKNILKNINASISGTLSAQDSVGKKPVKNTTVASSTAPNGQKAPVLTEAQKTCIKAAQDKRMAAMKPATDELKVKTETALKTRQEAIAAAQKIKDEKKKGDAIKAANDAYNNDASVVESKTPYMSVVKAANDQFQIDQKACLSGSGKPVNGFFKNIGDSMSNFGKGFVNFFTGKKSK